MNKKLLSLAVVSALSIGFSGCGSSSDSSPAVVEGTFVDAPVYGLSYKTATQDGFTDASGKFKYIAGETVEFKLGNLSFGTVTAGALMTPYTMAGDTNTSAPSTTATNIAMLLQSFDSNRSNGNILDLSKLKEYTFTDVNLSVTTNDMTTKLTNMFADNNFSTFRDTSINAIVSATNANNAMKTYVDSKIEEMKTPASSVYKIYTIHKGTNMDLATATSWVATNQAELANNKVEAKSTTCSALGYVLNVTDDDAPAGSMWYSKTGLLDGNEYCVEFTWSEGNNDYLVSSTGRKL